MKPYIKILSLIFLFIICGCSKDNEEDTNTKVCTNLITESPSDILVSDEKLNLAKSLFNTNEINFSNLQITEVEKDKYNHYHVRCNQFINGLKIFWGDVIFHFNENEEYYFLSGNLIENISLNNRSNLGYDILISKYLNEVKNDPFNKSKIDEIIKNCLDIQFGYFDLNAGISNETPNFIKAWIISAHYKNYPKLLVSDANPEITFYEDGIIIN